jgi:hypothetical protein
MKRTVAKCGLLLAAILVGAFCITVPAAHAGGPGADGALVNGDTNCDGNRDMSDAVLMLNWLFLGGGRPCPLADPPDLVERIAELEAAVARRDAALDEAEPEALRLFRPEQRHLRHELLERHSSSLSPGHDRFDDSWGEQSQSHDSSHVGSIDPESFSQPGNAGETATLDQLLPVEGARQRSQERFLRRRCLLPRPRQPCRISFRPCLR